MFRILPSAQKRGYSPSIIKRLNPLLLTLVAMYICIAPVAADMDGQDAVSRAQKLLTRLGMQKAMVLERLTDRHYITKEKCWAVQLKDERGSVTVVLEAHTGQALLIQRSSFDSGEGNHEPTPEVETTHDVSNGSG